MSRKSSSPVATERALRPRKDRLSGLAFAAGGLALAWYGRMLKAPETLGDVGPGFFPFLIGIGMAILGAVLAFVPARRATASAAAQAQAEAEEAAGGGERWILATVFVAAAMGYVAIFGLLGFSNATAIYLSVAMALLGKRSMRALLVFAASSIALTALLGWLLFRGLAVPLTGVWFIN